MFQIESFLSARLFLVPQIVGERLFFVSNLSGHLSLYGMYYGGSVPEPLIPPNISLHNPHMLDGHSFIVLPHIGKILVMIDQDGDENYQPMLIPMDGGYPETIFDNHFSNHRVHLGECDVDCNLVYLSAESREKSMVETFVCNLENNTLTKLAESEWGANPVGHSADHGKVLLVDGYTMGDSVLYLLESGHKQVLFGKPMDLRKENEVVAPNGMNSVCFCPSEKSLLVSSAIFDDGYSLGALDMEQPGSLLEIKMHGITHSGNGELEDISHLAGNKYMLQYNIDGCSWLYEGIYNESKREMDLIHVLVGDGDLCEGVLEHKFYDKSGDRFVISFSTAISPTQIYTIEGKQRDQVVIHTNEKILGIPEETLSRGEDASFTSFDGTRISARLYRPAETTGFKGPRPLVYYIHGGPQGQERPDFAWFSMPLIEYLALRGFSVFVPNVRGSTGYGLKFAREVDRDWGGKDRQDHVHAMTRFLPGDKKLDLKRTAVVGRSYGGYMTLTLAGRHPDLWAAACDMFGPYDLITFSERIPETWKPYYRKAVGDADTPEGNQFLQERSPRTYLHNLACPMLVIQGRNDPRVVASESERLTSTLQMQGKTIDLMIFEDEGHDILKYDNRVRCYNAITDFFIKHLKP
jgi:pimeloyl-ACP methyl ester carboxylesterase